MAKCFRVECETFLVIVSMSTLSIIIIILTDKPASQQTDLPTDLLTDRPTDRITHQPPDEMTKHNMAIEHLCNIFNFNAGHCSPCLYFNMHDASAPLLEPGSVQTLVITITTISLLKINLQSDCLGQLFEQFSFYQQQ